MTTFRLRPAPPPGGHVLDSVGMTLRLTGVRVLVPDGPGAAVAAELMRDALGQALIVLVVGVGVGLALPLTAAAFIGDGVPFVATAGTTVLPALALTVLGVLGVTGALGYVGRTSPLAAMGGQR